MERNGKSIFSSHNQQVPGSSPGGATTLEIKHLPRGWCFFIFIETVIYLPQTNGFYY